MYLKMLRKLWEIETDNDKAVKSLEVAIRILVWMLGSCIIFILFLFSIADFLFYFYLITSGSYLVWWIIRYWTKKYSISHSAIGILIIASMYFLYSYITPVFDYVNSLFGNNTEKTKFDIGTLDIAFGFLVFGINLIYNEKDQRMKSKHLSNKQKFYVIVSYLSLFLFAMYLARFLTMGLLKDIPVRSIDKKITCLSHLLNNSMLNIIENRATMVITLIGLISLSLAIIKKAKIDKKAKEANELEYFI